MKKIKVATVCSGIGSPEIAIEDLNVEHEVVFACDIDKFATASYLSHFEPKKMLNDMTAEEWVGEDFYSDLFIGGIPCQAFSLAGKRLGELDKRGLLFYDFYRYVKNQQPKVFIIENVKGLLSDNKGKTFQNWLLLLGDTVNGHTKMFNHPDSLGYNLHHAVLNAKDFGLPQNRERVFIVGIRPDLPNNFRFPTGFRLTMRLKDILEEVVHEKYYLSDKNVEGLIKDERKAGYRENENTVSGFRGDKSRSGMQNQVFHKADGITNTLTTSIIPLLLNPSAGRIVGRNPENPKSRVSGLQTEQTIEINQDPGITNTLTNVQKDNVIIESEPTILQTNLSGQIFENDYAGTLRAGASANYMLVKEATKKGFAIAGDGDSINLSNPNSETRRGRVGVGVANTLDTSCNQAVITKTNIRRLTPLECWRLQGFPDEYFYQAKYQGNEYPAQIIERYPNIKRGLINAGAIMSDSQLYKQAGNSMAKTVMKAIIKNLLHILQL